jgi:hypothetical protein
MKLALRFSIGLLLLILSSCVPTVSKVYQAPRVVGQVIDLATMKPIAGVNVAHKHNTKNFVTTNSDGEFELPSASETEFKLLMAGHGLKNNLVTLYNQNNQIVLVAQATLNARTEETVNFSTIIFDSQARVIAAPTKKSYLDYYELKRYFTEHNLLSSCDQELSSAALTALNTSRKVATLAAEDNKFSKIMSVHYKRTAEIWRELKSSCERTTSNYVQIDKVFEAIETETARTTL